MHKRRAESGHRSADKRRAQPSNEPVRGESIALEKSYFRLTSLPNPEDVRSERVLAEALQVVRYRWQEDGDYTYAREQLRSIRQDLTVQHIQNELTAEVYETHARIAIESDDLDEFNVCQAQLQPLHAAGVRVQHAAEFCAYRVLYNAVVPPRVHAGAAVLTQLQQLNARALQHPAIAQALSAHLAIAANDFAAFFRLRGQMYHLGAHFLDRLVPEMRRLGLRATCHAYEPTLPLARLSELLGFPTERAAEEYLRRYHGAEDEHFVRRGAAGEEVAGEGSGVELATRPFRQRAAAHAAAPTRRA